mgnify:CR=1 FL=1
MSTTSNVITGIIGGVAIGATLGILFAPAKGTKTRRRIQKTVEDSTDAIVEKSHEWKEQLNHLFTSKQTEFQEELDRMVDHLSLKADDVIDALEKKLAMLKEENEKIKMN